MKRLVALCWTVGLLLTLFGALLNWPGRIGLLLLVLWLAGEMLLFRKAPKTERRTMIGKRPFMWGREPGLLGDWLSK